MTQGILIGVGLVAILAIALLVIVFGVYAWIRDKRKTTKIQEDVRSFDEPVQTTQTSSFTRQDQVFGTLIVDGVEYTTFDEGEIFFYKQDRAVISVKVSGYNNQQRSINYVRVGDDLESEEGNVFYVAHQQQHTTLFNQWMDTQVSHNGELKREVLAVKDLMLELGKFNTMLSQRQIRKSGKQYVWTA